MHFPSARIIMAPTKNRAGTFNQPINFCIAIPSATEQDNVAIAPRQAATATVTVVADSNTDGNKTSTLNGGAIAGIVIGSVVGILLLIWVIKSCFNFGAPRPDVEPLYHPGEPKRHHRSHRGRRHSRSPSVSLPSPVVIRRPLSESHSRQYRRGDDRGRQHRIYRTYN